MPPDRPGTYVLLLRLSQPSTITTGRLGHFRFSPGWYTYVGSARGPGGLAARLSRHLRVPKSLHWHLDYLRAEARPVEVWYAVGPDRCECAWAQALVRLGGAALPVPGFGASDCRCSAHLIHFDTRPRLTAFSDAIGTPLCSDGLEG